MKKLNALSDPYAIVQLQGILKAISMTKDQINNILIIGVPILLGLIVVLINSSYFYDKAERCDGWIRRRKEDAYNIENRFWRYLLGSALWLILISWGWTERINNRRLKNGIRLVIILYVIEAVVYAIMIAIAIVVAIAFLYFLLWLLMAFLGGGGGYSRYRGGGWSGSNQYRTRIDPETGDIERRGMFGWRDTNRRYNPETGRHQRRGLFGWFND